MIAKGHSTKVYLEDYCGKTLMLPGSFTRLKLTRRDDYPDNFNCTASVVTSDVTHSGNPSRLMVVVHKLETICPGDKLRLLDGNTSTPLKALYFCGKHEPEQAMYTVASQLTVNFESDASRNDDGFELYITRFHLGICGDDEFRCAKGPCIDKSLHCDDYDQCGDDSDECEGKSGLVAAIIGAMCLGSLLTLIVLCCCCPKYRICCNKSKTQGHVQRTRLTKRKIHSLPLNDAKMTKPDIVLSMPPSLKQEPPLYTLSPPAYSVVVNDTSVDGSEGPLPTKTPIN
ncbi:uncharacterized protein LOC133191736 [Saccostrea echinata]|uniref:uncharacterized protein LOC133191736 n=1 Tax=Saccostrea echinata TaxID=191078 RepID=UPI002A7EAC0C|nr:uncharacterized protein LOC133191736 [Saccostrea echinata]